MNDVSEVLDSATRDRFRQHLREIAPDLNLDGPMVDMVFEMVNWARDLDPESRQMVATLLMISWARIRGGSTRIRLSGDPGHPMAQDLSFIFDSVPDDLVKWSPDPQEFVTSVNRILNSQAASDLVGKPGDHRPLILTDTHLYHHDLHQAEITLADRLHGRLKENFTELDPGRVRTIINEVVGPRSGSGVGTPESGRIRWTEAQIEAIRSAASQRLTFITGGPGTGKTTIVLSILRVLVRLGIHVGRITLAAPTGKAAHRLGSQLMALMGRTDEVDLFDHALADVAPPTTIHRLLDYSPHLGRFRRHPNYPIDTDVLIIDEASMIDLRLMERIIGATPPGARLVFLGDADQIPSIQAGSVFRDLTMPDSGSERTSSLVTRLTHSFRMDPSDPAGRQILLSANRIRDGLKLLPDSSAPSLPVRSSGSDVLFSGLEILEASPEDWIQSWMDRIYPSEMLGSIRFELQRTDAGFTREAIERLESAFGRIDRHRILCLTRTASAGTVRMNQWVHGWLVDRLKSAPFDYLPGEPVIVLQNDYRLELFNGDIGLVFWVREKSCPPELMIVLQRPGTYACHPLSALRSRIELAHALTVHKAQGSEYDHVVLMVPDMAIPIATREILYTGMTRARRSVTLVGSTVGQVVEIVDRCAATSSDRDTGLIESLTRRGARP